MSIPEGIIVAIVAVASYLLGRGVGTGWLLPRWLGVRDAPRPERKAAETLHRLSLDARPRGAGGTRGRR